MFITSYSDFNQPLNEYPKSLKGRKLHKWIKQSLRNRSRISIFEVCDDLRMARTIQYSESIGSIKLCNKGMQYPYLKVIKC